MSASALLSTVLSFSYLLSSSSGHLQGKEYWNRVGLEELERAVNLQRNEGIAKNVIVFIGDGMGVNTVTAGRIFSGGEESRLAFEHFPHVGMMKTYGTNKQVPDSACTATAIFCGVKTNYETLGVTADVDYGDCDSSLQPSNRLESIMLWAQEAGKATGIVTNTRITHATPAATYAVSAARHWECNTKSPKNAKCKDIARQLVEDSPGKNYQVILGGGLQCMKSKINITESDPIENSTGVRNDDLDLIDGWLRTKQQLGLNAVVAKNTSQLTELDTNKTDYLMGIFTNSHLPYEYKRDKSPGGTPSLSLMTTTAVKMLKKNKNGFFLMVEGGMIDQAHHLGVARIALEEVEQFSIAVNDTMNLVKDLGILDETLILVTSDHGHTLSINGYPDKGSDILGIATKSKVDGIPWTTLTYGVATKQNYQFSVVDGKVKRQDPREMDTTSHEFRQLSLAQHDLSAHGGGDVIAFARGPMAHLIHSVHEQSYITYVISYAAKIGPFTVKSPTPNSDSSLKPLILVNLLIPVVLFVILNFVKVD